MFHSWGKLDYSLIIIIILFFIWVSQSNTLQNLTMNIWCLPIYWTWNLLIWCDSPGKLVQVISKSNNGSYLNISCSFWYGTDPNETIYIIYFSASIYGQSLNFVDSPGKLVQVMATSKNGSYLNITCSFWHGKVSGIPLKTKRLTYYIFIS